MSKLSASALSLLKPSGKLLGDDLLDLVAAVEDDLAGAVQDRERARPVGLELVVIAVAVGIAVDGRYVQTAECLVGLQGGSIGKRCRIEFQVGYTRIFAAVVALVGDHVVGFAIGLEARDIVRHVHAEYRPVRDIYPAVLVGRVQAIAGLVVVLQAERLDVGERLGLEVQNADRVVLLERHGGCLAVR